MRLQRGDPAIVRLANGSRVPMRVLGPGQHSGTDVVLVCPEEDWAEVVSGELVDSQVAIPWPATEVVVTVELT